MVSRTLCICAIGLVAFLLTNLPGDSDPQQIDAKLVAHMADDESEIADGKVGLLDINKVFEKHVRFQERFKELGDKFKRLEGSAKKEQEEMKKTKEAIEKLPPGPERQMKEAKLAKEDSDLRLAVNLEQKALAEEESKIYLETYQEIEAKCEEFAAKKGMTLILRTMSVEMKAGDANSVKMGLGRMIIYQRGHDITDAVIEELRNNKGPIGPKAARPNVSTESYVFAERSSLLEDN